MRRVGRSLLILVLLGGTSFLGWKIHERIQAQAAPPKKSGGQKPAPVEVGAVTRGAIELLRTFSGTLEAPDELVVASKIQGRVKEVGVHLSDPVRRGQIVVRIDDDEYVQAVAQAEADLLVAQANLTEAESALKIADRALERMRTLRERGVASESQFDVAIAEQLSREAAVAVARAQISRAESTVKTARIRLGYTVIAAEWSGAGDERVVAHRYVDEGGTVAANAPLLTILELDPITGVLYVPERDYARLSVGQVVSLSTDAYPREVFPARIERIAPTFRSETRQARVELRIDNPGRRLKPGMFIRATVVLARVEDALLVPAVALTKRDDKVGVFVVSAEGNSVSWKTLEIGIQDAEHVQVLAGDLAGRVVTLGQQLVDDGSLITIPEAAAQPGSNASSE